MKLGPQFHFLTLGLAKKWSFTINYFHFYGFSLLFKVNFDHFWGRFWPPLRPKLSQTYQYEAWPLVLFFYFGISQKMDLYYQSFSFLRLFPLFMVNFDLFWGRFWPPLRPKVSQTYQYEAQPLVPFFYFGISQKTDLYFHFYGFFPLKSDFGPFLGAILGHS